MKTLYIHIGSHKTGSTSIQNSLKRDVAQFKKNNLSIFMEKPNSKINKNANSSHWIEKDKKNFKSKGASIINKKELAEKLVQLEKDVIMSGEGFSWIFNQQELIELKNTLSQYFDKIYIICFLRRQDKQAISHHQQGARSNLMAAAAFYGHSPTALPAYSKYLDNYLDYNKRLSMWADVFGDDSLKIRIYDKKYLLENDAVCDFYSLFNMHQKIHSYTNPSQGFERTKIGHIANQIIDNTTLSNVIKHNLSNEGKLLPSRDEAIAFYSKYIESNIALNKRFGVNTFPSLFDEDFQMYSEVQQDQWSEETANQAISNILYSVNSLLSHLSPDDFYQAANICETTNQELSHKLMQIAVKLQPDLAKG